MPSQPFCAFSNFWLGRVIGLMADCVKAPGKLGLAEMVLESLKNMLLVMQVFQCPDATGCWPPTMFVCSCCSLCESCPSFEATHYIRLGAAWSLCLLQADNIFEEATKKTGQELWPSVCWPSQVPS